MARDQAEVPQKEKLTRLSLSLTFETELMPTIISLKNLQLSTSQQVQTSSP